MLEGKKRKKLPAIFLVVGGSVFIITFLLFGPPSLLKKSESSQFCASCHSMSEQYKSHTHSVHRQLRCVDCHLPNDNFFNHYLWKALDGSKDLFFQIFPRREDYAIRVSEHGKAVLQKNCLRCHREFVERINTVLNCASCHRKIGHHHSIQKAGEKIEWRENEN